MKISCIIDSLAAGGAEGNMARLGSGLARRGHVVSLTTLDASIPDFYEVPGVGRAVLPAEAGPCRWFDLRGQARRLAALREAVAAQAPDVVISFVDAANILALAAFPSGTPPVIACERINPIHYRIGPHWRLLRRLLYPRAAKVVLLTKDLLPWARSLRPAWNAAAIANPVPPPAFSGSAQRPAYLTGEFNILAVGRLTGQKGFDLLLKAFAALAGKFPGWQLTVLGEGPDRSKLEALARDLGLAGRAVFPGRVNNPPDVLKYADLFVLSSRFEGFPNALAEAMACGVPAVSFDCPSGPGVIIRDRIDGILVPPGDIKALAAAMEDLMADKGKRELLGRRAPEIVRRFGLEKYLDNWETLLRTVAAAQRSIS